MTNDDNLYPLEKYLKDTSGRGPEFPGGKTNYFDRYKALKNYLNDNVWKNIGAMTSAEDGGVYTDHGPDHFDQVIHYAGLLLGEDSLSKKIKPYESYLILTAILLHDSGNIFGRKGHEQQALKILKAAGKAVYSDDFEARMMSTLAAVHGGKIIEKDGSENKDTIGFRQWPENYSYTSIPYRPNLVAAIVRFADEICEDTTRANKFILDHGQIGSKSEVFHHYAASIISVTVDLLDKSVFVNFSVDIKNALRKLGKLDGETYLMDEIFLRLEKMNCERIYCMRYMSEEIIISKIKARISLHKTNDKDEQIILDTLDIKIDDGGYPANTVCLSERYPNWVGENIRKIINNE